MTDPAARHATARARLTADLLSAGCDTGAVHEVLDALSRLGYTLDATTERGVLVTIDGEVVLLNPSRLPPEWKSTYSTVRVVSPPREVPDPRGPSHA